MSIAKNKKYIWETTAHSLKNMKYALKQPDKEYLREDFHNLSMVMDS